ncbi:DedA family protein [Microvirga antarctica]|uniref:DedA family protein n=1 Tax=Microvirga antarctica TaxID=2819233 RepID=UPI001B3035B0|nr:DedA family protein [Microvirga antarctica]
MTLADVTDSVVGFVRANHEFAPLILALLTFGESLAFVSLIIPAATILVGVGFVVAAADIPFWQCWLGAMLGGVVGGWISFAIGRRYKTAAYRVWPLSRHERLIERGERFFQRYGPWAVFFGRFFGPTRAVLPLIAGIFLMPGFLFQSANMASAFVWAFIVLAPGAGLARYIF